MHSDGSGSVTSTVENHWHGIGSYIISDHCDARERENQPTHLRVALEGPDFVLLLFFPAIFSNQLLAQRRLPFLAY